MNKQKEKFGKNMKNIKPLGTDGYNLLLEVAESFIKVSNKERI
jgi:hypothetical protein